MNKYIILFKFSGSTLYVWKPRWYEFWYYGNRSYRKRLGYSLTTYKDLAHKFVKRRNIRFIMNDIALRQKKKPIMTQIN